MCGLLLGALNRFILTAPGMLLLPGIIKMCACGFTGALGRNKNKKHDKRSFTVVVVVVVGVCV